RWLGHHTVEAGYSRHHLLDTDIADGCSRQLSRRLLACGAGFEITEERQGSRALPRRLLARVRGGEPRAEWASAVGYLLASLGTQASMAAPAPSSNSVLEGSFVSFSIEA